MTVEADKVINVIRKSAEPLNSELLECLSHFPWKEVTEGWFQFGLMRLLKKAGYRSYPEYGLDKLKGLGKGKADIALFEPKADFRHPSMLIEVKAVGSGEAGFRKDAKRLAKAARIGVAGALVYITGATKGAEKAKEEKRFRSCFASGGATIIDPSWHRFKKQFESMPEASDQGARLKDFR